MDLEYRAAYNFMFNGYYDLPGIERPGLLHAYNPDDASWDALEDGESRLVRSPEVIAALGETVSGNLIDVEGQMKTRHDIASRLSALALTVDQQR